MKKYSKILIVFFLIIFSCCLSVFADEQEMSFEQKHSDKDLIFLCNEVFLEVKSDWSYTRRIHQKAKILKEEAKSLGELPLQYAQGRDTVKILYAHTITPDGKKHRYSKIQDFKTYNDYPMYSDAMVKIVTLPEVNVGSIVEFEAVVSSKGMPIKDAFWSNLEFNFARPTQEFSAVITFPKKLGINFKEFNLKHKPSITETPQTITYSWKIKNADPTEKIEEYLPFPAPDSLENAMDFSSIKSWEDVSKWYYALVLKNLKPDKTIVETAKAITQNYASIRDKTRAILEYIQDNFRYVSMSFGENSLEPHPADQIFRNKYGDCKDLSLLSMAMLKAVGISSHVALFNNEFSISDPRYDLPMPDFFDHVLLLVKDEIIGNFYVDPLLDGYDIGEFPLSYQGAYTFIIDEQGGRFDRFPVFDEKRDSKKSTKHVTLHADGSVLVETEEIWELDSSIETRENIKGMDQEDKDQLSRSIDSYFTSGGEMIEKSLEGLDAKYGTLKSHFKYKKKDEYPLNGDMMIIDITGYERNLDFTQKERKKPIFYPGNSLAEEITTFKIPEGFVVSHMPKNLSLKMGFFEIERKYQRNKDTITASEIERFRRSQYPKEDYAKFKDFFDKLSGQTQQRIILKKMNRWQKWISEVSVRFRK